MEPSKTTGLLKALSVVCVLLILYFISSSIIVFESTGVLRINSPDKNANIVLSQQGHQALQIGIGAVSVRLKPGNYQVSAFDSGKQSNATTEVVKGKQQTLNLGALVSVTLPTLSGVNFSGFNGLINHGMQSSQLSSLEQGLFKFSPYSKAITLQTNSLNFAPFNPNSASTFSSINFQVLIGDKSYNAICNYDNLGSSLSLVLLDASTNTSIYEFNN